MMNSASVLKQILERYCQRYQGHNKRPISLREIASLLELDPNVLSRWSSENADISRRIPITKIPFLAEALLLSQSEHDELMASRLSELVETDKTAQVICDWLTNFMNRATALSKDESAVINALHKASVNYPRGLYHDEGESAMLVDGLSQVLKRAEELATDEASIKATAWEVTNIANFKKSFSKKNINAVSIFRAAISRAKKC